MPHIKPQEPVLQDPRINVPGYNRYYREQNVSNEEIEVPQEEVEVPQDDLEVPEEEMQDSEEEIEEAEEVIQEPDVIQESEEEKEVPQVRNIFFMWELGRVTRHVSADRNQERAAQWPPTEAAQCFPAEAAQWPPEEAVRVPRAEAARVPQELPVPQWPYLGPLGHIINYHVQVEPLVVNLPPPRQPPIQRPSRRNTVDEFGNVVDR